MLKNYAEQEVPTPSTQNESFKLQRKQRQKLEHEVKTCVKQDVLKQVVEKAISWFSKKSDVEK